MSRVDAVFSRRKHKALIPYVTVGYPSIEATLKVVPMLARSGADIIELGIPFSDPLADGATIQKASFQALSSGVTPSLCLEVAEKLRQEVETPLLFMTYLNPVLNYGFAEFCSSCARAGVSGLIIPDLPPEEGAELEDATRRHELDLVYLLAPNSTEDRIRLVAEKSRSFIYLVSITGVTGTRDSLPEELDNFVARVRRIASQPLCVGFGISTPEQARRVAQIADGVIVGSRLIQLLEEDVESVRGFAEGLRKALDEVTA
ncbi:tryptophan synthase subunit alpha [Chloroflexota bacterium]